MTDLDSRWCKHSKCCVCTKEKFCGPIVRGYDFILVSEDELKYRWKKRIYDHRSLMELASMQDVMRYYKERETKEKEMMAVSIETVDIEKEKAKARDEGYKAGLEEAWEIVRKITLYHEDGGLDGEALRKIFGESYYTAITPLAKFSIHEVKEKFEAYEAEQAKPKLGDVVEIGDIGEFLFLGEGREHYYVLDPTDNDGIPQQFVIKHTANSIRKTGKHFDIQSMLDEIG